MAQGFVVEVPVYVKDTSSLNWHQYEPTETVLMKTDSIPTSIVRKNFTLSVKNSVYNNKVLTIITENPAIGYHSASEFVLFDTVGINLQKIFAFSDMVETDSSSNTLVFSIYTGQKTPGFFDYPSYTTWCTCEKKLFGLSCNIYRWSVNDNPHPPYDYSSITEGKVSFLPY